MIEDRTTQLRDEGDRAAEVGWEPPDWTDILRRRRRRQVALPTALVLWVLVAVPLLRWTVVDRPLNWTYWVLFAVTLVLVAEVVLSRVSATGRADWERDTRQEVRVEHALRHHVGIGESDRALVTERARQRDTWSKVAFVGWPLLAVALVTAILDHPDLPAFLVVPVVAACLLLLARSVRRARLARRWLADPLPRDDDIP